MVILLLRGEMAQIATITARALERLQADFSAKGGEGKAFRILFEGFG